MKPAILRLHYLAQVSPNGLPNSGSGDPTKTALTTALDIVFGITAAIAVLMIVIAGFRYIISRGDPNGTAQARNTIIYAVVGLFVTLAAYAIVTFVLKGLS